MKFVLGYFNEFQVSTTSENNGAEVIFVQDVAGMFCLDTTPEVGKEKKRGPKFTRVRKMDRLLLPLCFENFFSSSGI